MQKPILAMTVITGLAAAMLSVFYYLSEPMLGVILSTILVCWTIAYWGMSRMIEKKTAKPVPVEPEKKYKAPRPTEEAPEEPTKDLSKLNEYLERLKKTSKLLDDEKAQGVLSEESYTELKRQNSAAMKKIEKELYG